MNRYTIVTRPWVARILVLVGASAAATLDAACSGDTFSAGDAAADASNDGAGDSSADASGDAAHADGSMSDGHDTTDASSDAISLPDIPSVRRPFLVGSSMRAADAATRDDWSDALPPAHDLDTRTREALARVWLADGLQEHASVAAFARFSLLMLGVGAPADLVRDSQRAALDEVRHARACFSLARRYGAEQAGPAALRVDDALGSHSLAELAALTAEEGCVGETLGALLAEEQAALATDPIVRSLLRRIADDETRHAELAWRFVAWAISKGGDAVLEAVQQAVSRAITATLAMEIRPLDVDARVWSAHGRLSCAESRAIASRGIREVIEPAMRALATNRAVMTASEHQTSSHS